MQRQRPRSPSAVTMETPAKPTEMPKPASATANGVSEYLADLRAERERVRELQRSHRRRKPARRSVTARLADWDRENGSRSIRTIKPPTDAYRPLQRVLGELRLLVGDGLHVRLTPRGRLTITMHGGDIPNGALWLVSDAGRSIADYLGGHYMHRDCPRSARPVLIPGQRFAVRCSFCQRPLRRKLST